MLNPLEDVTGEKKNYLKESVFTGSIESQFQFADRMIINYTLNIL